MRFFFFSLLLLLPFLASADPCAELRNVTVHNISVSYSSTNGTEIKGNFRGLSPATFRVQYRNLTDRGRWKTATNPSIQSNAGWYIRNLQPAKEYKVRIFAPYYDEWCQVGMHHIWTYVNTADFNLNGQNAGTLSICGNDPITMNAAASKYEDSYGIAIREIDQSGRGIGNELLREFRGSAPNGIDIRQFTRRNQFSLIGGKRYYVKLFTKPNWQEKIIFLEMKQASISLQPRVNKVPNTTDQYYSCVPNGTPRLMVDTRASSCDVRYMVKIVEMNGNQEVASTMFNKWIEPFTPLPDQLDLATIYRSQQGLGFQTGKKYKVIIAVGFPWAAQHFYVQFYRLRDCPAYQQQRRIGL